MQQIPWYRPGCLYLLRVPTLPAEIFTLLQRGCIELTQQEIVNTEQVEQTAQMEQTGQLALTEQIQQRWQHAYQSCLSLLSDVSEHPDIAAVIQCASPSLYEAIYGATQAQGGTRRSRRAMERLMRYIIRSSTRPTPFGACAGVAFGHFAERSRLDLQSHQSQSLQAPMVSHTSHTVGLRPDAQWLHHALQPIEARVLSALHVQLNPAIFLQGKRGVVTGRNTDEHGGSEDQRIWFKWTPVVDVIAQCARTPIAYADLRQAIRTTFPQASAAMIDSLLQSLYHSGVLLTTLMPLEELDPFDHVIKQLQTLPEVHEEVAQFTVLQARMASSPADLAMIEQQQRMMTPDFKGITFQVDTRMHLEKDVLSATLGQEAAHIAEVLLRLSLFPQDIPSLHQARRLFLERYEEQEVPLLDLFKPQGLLANLYDQDLDPNELPLVQQQRRKERAHFLRTLAMQAVNAQEQCVELTPESIQRLSCWQPETAIPPLLDLYMHVSARSLAAIDRGEWQGMVTLLPTGGRSYRRFLHLFGETERQEVGAFLRAEQTLMPEHLLTTLLVQPDKQRDLNVMHGPVYGDYCIPINCVSPRSAAATILPSDILVSLQHGRFYLRSRHLAKPLRVQQQHMLAFTHIPPIARFLLEASREGEPFPSAFQWGGLDLPFLPRLTYGRWIVSLAQWTLSRELLARDVDLDTASARWFLALQRWRKQWHVPRLVFLLKGEDRILLDLEHPMMVDFLRQELLTSLRERQTLTLQEAPFPDQHSHWLHDQRGRTYLSELVIPLIRTSAVSIASTEPTEPTAPTALTAPAMLPPVFPPFPVAHAIRYPAQEWLFLKVYGPAGLQNALLTGPLQCFLQQQQPHLKGWFFVRYTDPLSHLRLRFHVRDEQHRPFLQQTLFRWSQELQTDGLITRSTIDEYEREVERYGGPEAIGEIEQVFAANSEAMCALLHQHGAGDSLLFAAVLAQDRLWQDWGYDLAACHDALRQSQRQFLHAAKETPVLRQQRSSLLAFLAHPPAQIEHIFDAQRPALVQASMHIRRLAGATQLWRKQEDILWSLSHLQCNRLLGTRREHEREAYAAWFATVKARYHCGRMSP
jgi:thiopeptide-type bacteriocin biosynthesis domain